MQNRPLWDKCICWDVLNFNLFNDMDYKYVSAYLRREGYKSVLVVDDVNIYANGKHFAAVDKRNLQLHRHVNTELLMDLCDWPFPNVSDLREVQFPTRLLEESGAESARAYVHPFRENELIVQLDNQWCVYNQHGDIDNYETRFRLLSSVNDISYHLDWVHNPGVLENYWWMSDSVGHEQIQSLRIASVA